MNILDILGNRSVLVSISRICDLIKLDFRNETGMICVHIQSALMRGLKNDKLLISSNDIFCQVKITKRNHSRNSNGTCLIVHCLTTCYQILKMK